MPDNEHEEPGSVSDMTLYFIFTLTTACLAPLLYGYHLVSARAVKFSTSSVRERRVISSIDIDQSELNAPQDVITCAKPSTAPHDQSSLPQCLEMDTLQIGVVNSILTIGGLIGALVSGTIAAQYGRRPALLYNAAFLILGPILEAAAPAVWVLALGRFISGIGVGTSTVVTPLFISEIAIPKFKGFFGSFTQTSINAGILLAQVLGYFLSKGQLWRVILGSGGVVGVLHFVFLFFMNESPKWLAENGRAAQGKQVLRRLRGHKADIVKEVNGWNLGDAEEREGCC